MTRVALNIGELVGYIGLDTKDFDDALDKAGDKLGSGNAGKFKGAAISAGLAIGGLLAASIAKAMDMQAANAKLAGQLGITTQQAGRYSKIAGQVYSDNWGASLDEVNDTVVAITQKIGEGNDAWLKSTSEKILAFTSTFGADMDSVTEDIGTMLNTGVAKSADEALDILTTGMQNGDNKAGDLLDTFQEYPVQFAKLGLSGQAALGLISQGLQGGARDSDIVADALKEFSIRAVDGSTQTAQGFKMLGLSAGTMSEQITKGGSSATDALDLTLDKLRAIPDPVKRSQAAVMLFGTQAEDLGQALYSLDPSSAVAALGDVAGAAQKMTDTVGASASGTIETWKRKAQLAFVNVLGGKILPVIQTAGAWLMTKLGPAIDWVKDKWPAISAAISTAWTGTIWPALQAFGEKVGVLLETFLKPLVQWISDNWPQISQTVADAWNNVIAPALQKVGDVLSWVWQHVFQPFVDYVNEHGPQIQAVISQMASFVSSAFQVMGTIITTAVNGVKTVIAAFQQTWQNVSSAVRAAAGLVSGAFSAISSTVSGVYNSVKTAFDNVVTFVTGIPGKVVTAIGSVGSTLYDAGKSIIDGFFNGLKNAWDKVTGFISGIAGWIADHKGPLSYDKTLLIANGQAIMSGLNTGLLAGFGDTQKLVDGMGPQIAAAMQAPAVTIPGAGPRPRPRGGDGASAATPYSGPQKVVHQDVKITAGWSAKETDSFLAMQAGTG